MSSDTTTLFRARVPTARLRKAEKILDRLGMKPGDALNMLLAQIEIREALPFEVTIHSPALLAADQQGTEWNNAFGSY
ncbi:MAG: hypothetical protein EOP86_19965 [Verrucomicrobiaceae bacterium]|nr:MAG: hypothetical protein EOP86_19965 [Verrucomicrobiaceae bacterium]